MRLTEYYFNLQNEYEKIKKEANRLDKRNLGSKALEKHNESKKIIVKMNNIASMLTEIKASIHNKKTMQETKEKLQEINIFLNVITLNSLIEEEIIYWAAR